MTSLATQNGLLLNKLLEFYNKDNNLQKEYMDLIKNCTEDIKDNNNQNKIIRKVCNEINLNINYDD